MEKTTVTVELNRIYEIPKEYLEEFCLDVNEFIEELLREIGGREL